MKRVLTGLLLVSAASMIGVGATRADPGFEYNGPIIDPVRHAEPALEDEHYRVEALSYPSVGENGQPGNAVKALYYQSRYGGRHKLVIVLPIWGTHTYPPEKMSESLLRYSDGDMNVLRIFGENYLIDWERLAAAATEEEFRSVARRMGERVRTHVIDIRRAVRWAEVQPETDPARIGLIGFSMSATVGAGVLQHEPGLAAGALVMGGAHPHKQFSHCFGRAQELREDVMKRFGWTLETYERAFEAPFSMVDPARYPGMVDPRRVIMFEARWDTCMPKEARHELWQAMGEPKRIRWPYNHKMAFLMMSPLGLNTMRRQIYRFLDEVLTTLPRGSTTAPAIEARAAPATAR